MNEKAKLILKDNTVFEGISFAGKNSASGEVVFNTGMTGYPETLSDPSYRGQILVLTYPLIGNYGIPGNNRTNDLCENFESDKVQIAGLIISDYSEQFSHWQSVRSLSDWLKDHNIPALFDIDTRELTKKLREKGSMPGKIVIDDDPDFDDPNKRNLVKEVSIKEPVTYNDSGQHKIVVVDCGVKNNIIRSLIKRDCKVTRVPWDYDFTGLESDAIVISNGPGDPKMCKETISNVRKILESIKPLFGICLGNQVLALAAGADTYKLKYGHRSQNQPCVVKGTKRCYITSQNHGYAVKEDSLPNDWELWFENLNDGTNEGIRHKSLPFMSVQFHPEAVPGPVDTNFLFDEFLKRIQ